MLIRDALTGELKHEAVNTRKILERVPADKFEWQPHAKSMTLGRLASHIAEIPVWVNRTMDADNFNFGTFNFSRAIYPDTVTLLKVFDDTLAAAIASLQNADDETLNAKYTVLRGEQLMFELPRRLMVRNICLNHIIHHRGQLSVFLRLLDVAVPGMYGPSADER